MNDFFGNLKTIITNIVPLNLRDIELCQNYFKLISVKKNTVIEKENHIPHNLYFINSGYLRLSYTDKNGVDITTYLGSKDDFITSFLSFIHQTHAKETLESITNCELLTISYNDMKKLIGQSDNFKTFSVTIFEKAIALNEIRANDLVSLTGEERYKKIMLKYPELIQNIPLKYIASYIGVKPESLSRIRRNIIS